MGFNLLKYKGIHPGAVVERELKKRSIKQRPFAISIGEYPQTFNAIIKGKRSLTTSLALKIEKELNIEEGTLLILQVFYDIEQEKKKLNNSSPNLSIIRKALFWDTDYESIDWVNQYKAVIKRVYERGNKEEIKEINRFYGANKVKQVLNAENRKPYAIHKIVN